MAAKGLKQRIRDGEIINGIGVAMDVGRTELEDYLAKGSYDYLSVDCQHVAYSEEKLTSFCVLAQELDLPARVRIKHTRQAYLVGNYLDLGPSGIMVPEVETEEIVEEAVSTFYYPQKGKRSWGGTDRVGLAERSDRLEYAAWWNDYGVLTLQTESVDAVVNARQLAKPGVDVLAFGINDLNFSLEAHPHFPIRTYEDCVKHVVEQLDGTGVRVGVRPESEAEREMFLKMGVTVYVDRTDV
jgi:2-keto-3-deoxy-L-rhamnonate aldolase RhmA